MPSWLLWILAAFALGIGEIFTPGLFFLGPVAIAAGAAAIVAAFGAGWFVQLVVFGVGSIASLAVLRPIARAHLRHAGRDAHRHGGARRREGASSSSGSTATAAASRSAARSGARAYARRARA